MKRKARGPALDAVGIGGRRQDAWVHGACLAGAIGTLARWLPHILEIYGIRAADHALALLLVMDADYGQGG